LQAGVRQRRPSHLHICGSTQSAASSRPCPAMDSAPQRYEFVKELGAGSFGKVIHAK
jgi:hypothetical protein